MNAVKAARNQASLTNRPNCGGTAKKAGLGSNIGFVLQSNRMLRGAPKKIMHLCIPSVTSQTQKYGYAATHSGRMG